MKKAKDSRKNSLNNLRKEIQHTHLVLIVIITILLSVGSVFININANSKNLNQNLLNFSNLISRLYGFTKDMPSEQRTIYFNYLCMELPDVDVISIVDSRNIRVYHTNNNLIGTVYDGKIPDFQDSNAKPHIVEENGPSGPQRRTYAAIYDENEEYCGFIMTIVLKTSIYSVTIKTILLFIAVTLAAIIIEILISRTISYRIRQRLLGYEPDTFSSMFMVRDNILESIQEGIIAVDSEKNVEFANKVAKKILNCHENEKVNFIQEKVFADKILSKTLETGETIIGLQEKTLNGTELLIDCIPVKKENKITGAVAILHDRTEYTKLMEDLSGTKYLVDSMRANNHDFTNKLHVILGLIQIGEYDKAVSYIENISIIQRETLSKVMHSVDNPSFAALLIGKIARASECNVKFVLKEGIHFKETDINLPSEALVTIVGNLIDNALDAMNLTNLNGSNFNRELVFGAFTKPGELLISVTDNGCGIGDNIKNKVFENGFSTKGTNRGVGLYHTKQLVESLGGKIYFESQENVGTTFIVSFKR